MARETAEAFPKTNPLRESLRADHAARIPTHIAFPKPVPDLQFPKLPICQLVNFVDGAELRDLAESPEPELAEVADLALAWLGAKISA